MSDEVKKPDQGPVVQTSGGASGTGTPPETEESPTTEEPKAEIEVPQKARFLENLFRRSVPGAAALFDQDVKKDPTPEPDAEAEQRYDLTHLNTEEQPETVIEDEPKPVPSKEVTKNPPPKVEVEENEPPPEPEPDPLIVEFKGVTKIYGKGKNAFTAVKDINFKVEDIPDVGEFISILGPSGCGKSTILRMIAGLTPQHPPTYGEVLVQGKPVLGPGATRGMVFQDYTSFDHMTVLKNVAFGLECRGMARKEREEQAKEWINKVGLNVTTDAKKYPHELSGGMRQRVAIARTLTLHPRIILMDEPFGALDPSTRMRMQNLLIELWRELEATVFFITHSIEEAVFLGDRIHLLSSSPGTILREIKVPAPDRPAKEMQAEAEFLEYVFDIRDTIETLEASTRAGDD
jgi:NitT/TauT family transport system ATP-binding protein